MSIPIRRVKGIHLSPPKLTPVSGPGIVEPVTLIGICILHHHSSSSPDMKSLASSMPSTESTSHESPSMKHEKYYLPDGNIIFRVENILYKVHRYFFQQHSNHFATVLSLPQPEGQPVEGETDDNPIEILGVSAAAFDALLSIFYPSELTGTANIKTMEDWVTLLSLASQWEILALVKLCTKELAHIATILDKIYLARKFPELEDWLWDAFCLACTSHHSTSRWPLEDWQRLDKNDVILIAMGRTIYSGDSRNTRKVEQLMMDTFGLSE